MTTDYQRGFDDGRASMVEPDEEAGLMPSLAPAEEMQRRAAAICGLRGSEADRPAPKGSQRDEIGEALLRAWCEGLASRSAADGSGAEGVCPKCASPGGTHWRSCENWKKPTVQDVRNAMAAARTDARLGPIMAKVDAEAKELEELREWKTTVAGAVGPEIVAWLEGLERMRENVVSVSSDAREVAVMIARRGVYEGIADDIRRKWGSLFTREEGGNRG